MCTIELIVSKDKTVALNGAIHELSENWLAILGLVVQ